MVRASSRGGAIHNRDCGGNPMTKLTRRVVAALGVLVLSVGVAAAQSKTKVSIAVGGAGCLCYLPTVLAKQLGEYDKAGVEVELIDFKGGSQALQAVIGGSPEAKDIKSIKDLAGKAVGVSAPGSSTDFFLKYLLAKNGMDPAGTSVVGI